MSKSRILFAVVFAVVCVSLAAADTHYVSVNGPNDPGTGRPEDPFRRIQDAISAAGTHDIVEISPGLYTGAGNYELDLQGKSITIRSTDPENPEVVAATVIDPNGAGRGFLFYSGEDANCMILGLTVRNAHTGGNGAGLLCYNNSSPTIANCVITGNYAGTNGGGLFSQLSNPRVVECTIRGNSASLDGGGFECWSGSPQVVNCIIVDNKALNGHGGGIDCFTGEVTIKNCTIVGNSGVYGGALYCWSSRVTVSNAVIWANEAQFGSQLGFSADTGSLDLIEYSDIQGGEVGVYDPAGKLTWGSGNTDDDPCFAHLDFGIDSSAWDLHLQSADGRWEPDSLAWVSDANTSVCIDAGDPNSDWAGEPWPNGKRINIGAYGGTNQASRHGNPADFDIDGLVGLMDYAEFACKWQAQEHCIQDLTNNGVVDSADLRVFVNNWLWQKE